MLVGHMSGVVDHINMLGCHRDGVRGHNNLLEGHIHWVGGHCKLFMSRYGGTESHMDGVICHTNMFGRQCRSGWRFWPKIGDHLKFVGNSTMLKQQTI